jgi:hypothetical protein
MDVPFHGTRPLAADGQRLRASSDQIRSVGDDLDTLAARLGEHAGDASAIAADASSLRASVDEIDDSLGGPGAIGLTGSIAVIRLVLFGLLAWIGVLAGACVAFGRWVRRVGALAELAESAEGG